MKFANRLRKSGHVFFLLLWLPFVMIFLTGPFSTVIWAPGEKPASVLWTMTPWIILTVAFAVAGVFCFIASLLVGGFSNISIMAKGRDAEATVLSITDTGSTVNDNPILDFSLEVRPPDAGAFKAVARKNVSLIDLPSIQPGKTVHVRYIPGKEQVAIVDARDFEMLKAKGLNVDEKYQPRL